MKQRIGVVPYLTLPSSSLIMFRLDSLTFPSSPVTDGQQMPKGNVQMSNIKYITCTLVNQGFKFQKQIVCQPKRSHDCDLISVGLSR